MNRRQRRQSMTGHATAPTAVSVTVGRLTLEGVSPHVGRRIGESLQRGLQQGFEDARRLPDQQPETDHIRAVLHSGLRDAPERIGDNLAALLTERLMP